jgi:hypothetical protein
VINMEHEAYDRGLARNLAEALGGPCYCLAELKAAELYRTVRDELEGQQYRVARQMTDATQSGLTSPPG